MSKKENPDILAGIELQEGEEITADTLKELSNGKGKEDNENE